VKTTIATVGLITADRPAMVRRALESWARHCDVHERRPRFLVVDGSTTRVNRRATQSVVGDLRRATGHNLRYIGTEECARLAAALRRSGASDLALAPGSAGANRNLLLLLTAGERILTVDDDIVCDVWAAPGRRRDQIALTAHQDLRDVAYFRTRADALGSVRRSSANLLAEHEALLGRSLPQLVAGSSPPADVRHACGHLRSFLQARRRPIVKATFSGLAGDAATYCPGAALFRARPVRDRVSSNRRLLELAMTTHEITRIARKRLVTHDCHCMAGCMGLANHVLVPPFPDMSQNEDGVFGVLMAVCDMTTLFGHVPVGIVHDSPRASRRTGPRTPSASWSRMSELIINLLFRHAPALPEGSPSERVRAAGELLMGIGRIGPRAFVAVATDVTLAARRRELAAVQRLSSDPDCSVPWARELDRYSARLRDAMAHPAFVVPVEFHARPSLESGYKAAQKFVGTFGGLVAAWPEAWEMARTLNELRGPESA
jgi:hypothetical protein